MPFNSGFHKKHILTLWSMFFCPLKVLVKVLQFHLKFSKHTVGERRQVSSVVRRNALLATVVTPTTSTLIIRIKVSRVLRCKICCNNQVCISYFYRANIWELSIYVQCFISFNKTKDARVIGLSSSNAQPAMLIYICICIKTLKHSSYIEKDNSPPFPSPNLFPL